MEQKNETAQVVSLDPKQPIWDQFYMVAPLVVIGTKEGDHYDLAPKHMAMPVGFDNYFAFVCTSRHATYRNIREHGFFTVSFPKPAQTSIASITAGRRTEDGKPTLVSVPTFPARKIDGVFLKGGYLFFECKMERILDGFGKESMVIGFIEAVHVDAEYVRERHEEDDPMKQSPLLAYLSPGRFASIDATEVFPLPVGFER